MKSLIEGLLLLLNLVSFFVIGYDKYQAKNKGWRIREKTIFIMALMGGAVGVFLGMKVFRHKTKHKNFLYGVPLLVMLNVFIYIMMSNYFI